MKHERHLLSKTYLNGSFCILRRCLDTSLSDAQSSRAPPFELIFFSSELSILKSELLFLFTSRFEPSKKSPHQIRAKMASDSEWAEKKEKILKGRVSVSISLESFWARNRILTLTKIWKKWKKRSKRPRPQWSWREFRKRSSKTTSPILPIQTIRSRKTWTKRKILSPGKRSTRQIGDKQQNHITRAQHFWTQRWQKLVLVLEVKKDQQSPT